MNSRTLAGLLVFLALAMGAPDANHALDLTAPNSSEETITVSTAAIGVTSTVCKDAGGSRQPAIVQVKSQSIYFSLHSATATPDSGDFKANDGDFFRFSKTEIAKLRMIRSGSSDATVKVQCYDN